MRLAAIANRHVDGAARAWADAGHSDAVVANDQKLFDQAVARGRPVATSDPALLCHCENIDAIIEVTGHVESSAATVLEAIAGRKHIVLMNAELDATLGPILNARAEEAGVIYSNADGDEPGLLLNLIRHVRTIGYQPVMAGNLKGLLDRYRTAETQRGFAERTGQNAVMCAAYADGTKLNFEACVVANATGMAVARRGMFGPKCDHVSDVVKQIEQHLSPGQLLQRPIIDYVLGAAPGSGVFVVGYNDEPAKQHYMNYLKMGDGPLYVFYHPHVLPHLEVPLTVARAVLFGDAAVAPRGSGLRSDCGCQARPSGWKHAGWHGGLRQLRPDRKRRNGTRRTFATDGPFRWLPVVARDRQRRANFLSPRRASKRSIVRSVAR